MFGEYEIPTRDCFNMPRQEAGSLLPSAKRNMLHVLALTKNIAPRVRIMHKTPSSTTLSTSFSILANKRFTKATFLPSISTVRYFTNTISETRSRTLTKASGQRTCLFTSWTSVTMASKPSIPWSTDNKPITTSSKSSKPIPKPSPSASVIVISQANRILLLHRTKTSSAFPSAHVFPGGNLEASDGPLPEGDSDPARHVDSIAYRTGAIRELFEESGVLLARETASPDQPLLSLDPDTRMAGRNDVHGGKLSFQEWLTQQSPTAVLDTDSLIPFTHWITPTNVPKRFTTQMYVYFVPVADRRRHLLATADQVETMSPEWKRASEWCEEARSGKIILFPPQYILLYLIAEFLDKPGDPADGRGIPEEERVKRRQALETFIREDRSPVPWTDKFISPTPGPNKWIDGRQILALDKQGPELENSGLQGDTSRFVLVKFSKEGPREVDVLDRKEAEAQLAKVASTSSKL